MNKIIALAFIVLASLAHAETKELDKEDKLTVSKLLEPILQEDFLLGTTEYASKSIKKSLLRKLPEQIYATGYMTKKEYVQSTIDSIKLRSYTSITNAKRKIKIIECKYISDDTIDCDVDDHMTYDEVDKISLQITHISDSMQYKFNIKMNDSGKWYIQKMKVYSLFPRPIIDTLEIDVKEEQERLIPKTLEQENMFPQNNDNAPESSSDINQFMQ